MDFIIQPAFLDYRMFGAQHHSIDEKTENDKPVKSQICCMISTKEVWGTASWKKILKIVLENIFPLDPAQYPIRRFSLTAMQKYKEWPRN